MSNGLVVVLLCVGLLAVGVGADDKPTPPASAKPEDQVAHVARKYLKLAQEAELRGERKGAKLTVGRGGAHPAGAGKRRSPGRVR